MRIVGGRFRGRRISAPEGRNTRPTTDRVREAVFNILEHADFAPAFTDTRVLDGFAGSGALGLEAASRGARFVLFVETDAKARGVIRANVEALGLSGNAKIWRRDVTRMGRCAPMKPFDMVFLDPPYGRGLGIAALQALAEGGWLRDGALAVVEEEERSSIEIPDSFTLADRRTYGDTTVHFLLHQARETDTGGS